MASDTAANRLRVAALRLRMALKANFDPNQPRVPRGQGKLSGRWTDGGMGGGENGASASIDAAGPRAYIPIGSSDPDDETADFTVYKHPPPPPPLPKPSVGTTPPVLPPARPRQPALPMPPIRPPQPGESPLGEPPRIPEKRPSDYGTRLRMARTVAVWAAKLALRSSLGPAGHIWTAIEVAVWLREEFGPYIEAYLDEPKTLAELQAGAGTPRPGYQIHHIVEQAPALQSGFPVTLVDGRDNLVSIPTFKHYLVTGWFAKRNELFGMQSPREYLRSKDWSTRRKLGLEALRLYGVLKP